MIENMSRFWMTMTMVFCLAGSCALGWEVAGPPAPSPSEATAIRELQEYLSRCAGSLKVDGTEAVLLVGATDFAREKGIAPSEMAEESWLVKSFGHQVVLAGGGSRGTLYAVWHFLEDRLGVRWWNYWEESVPSKQDWSFPALDDHGRPFFRMREIYTGGITPGTMITNALRNRLNRVQSSFRIGKEHGGGYDYGRPGFVHTFALYLPPGKYFKDHPEYFALIHGARNRSQPCLTHPQVFRIFLERLQEFIRQDESQASKAGIQPPSLYNISMNDNWDQCKCPTCSSFLETERPSGLFIDFLNRLLHEIHQSREDICLETLAYYFTEEPPLKTKAAPQVFIRLCDTRSDNTFGLQHPHAKVFRELLAKWSATGVKLSIWDYGKTYFASHGLPLPSEFSLGKTMKTYADYGIQNFFWEHERNGSDDMHTLKFWMEAKLLENPYADSDKLFQDFMDGYYGAAAPYLTEYRQGLWQAVGKQQQSYAVYDCGPTAYTFISQEDMVRFQRLCDQAAEAVREESTLLRRVNSARSGLDRLCVLVRPQAYVSCGLDTETILKRYLETLKTQTDFIGFSRWPEGSHFHKQSVLPLKKNIEELLEYRKLFHYTPPDGMTPLAEFFPTDCRHLSHPGSFRVVKDDESSMGAAVRFRLGQKAFPVPVAFHGWLKTGDHLGKSIWPCGKGYQWYLVGTGRFSDFGYLYFTKTWQLQLPMGPLNGGQPVSLHVSLKFTQEDGEDIMYFDRAMVTEPKAGSWEKPVRFAKGCHFDSELLEILPDRKYRLEGEVRVISGNPRFHLGVRMLTEPGWKEISTPSVRMMDSGLAKVVETSGNAVTLDKPVEKAVPGMYLAFEALPGGADLPNFKLGRITESNGAIVTLDKRPSEAVAGTMCRVHGPGGYLYANLTDRHDGWQCCSLSLTGISRSYVTNAFWCGTRYAHMVLLVDGDGVIELRKARLKEVPSILPP